MLRWVVVLLLVLNLGVLLWGWRQDGPLESPLPPLAQAPGEILLGSEWSVPPKGVTLGPEIPAPRHALSAAPLGGEPPAVPAAGPDTGPAGNGSQRDLPMAIPPLGEDEPGHFPTPSR
jgi:hypothetical protein